MFANTPVFWCINTICNIENNMHIHVYAHKLYLPRSFVCIHRRRYQVHTCVYQAYATEVFMYCYWNLVHRIPAVVKVGTVSSLAAPGAVVMTVSCATGAALSTYSNRRTPRPCGRYFLKHLILYPVCMLGILLWFYWTHAIIYVYMYPDGFSEILWYV